MTRLVVLVCADIAAAVWLVAWVVETKVNEPYECDGVCQAAGIVAAVLLVGLLYATVRTVRAARG